MALKLVDARIKGKFDQIANYVFEKDNSMMELNNLNCEEFAERLMELGEDMLNLIKEKRIEYIQNLPSPFLNGDIANEFNELSEADYWDGDNSQCE